MLFRLFSFLSLKVTDKYNDIDNNTSFLFNESLNISDKFLF